MNQRITVLLTVCLIGLGFSQVAESAPLENQLITRSGLIRNAVLSLAGKELTEYLPQSSGKFFIDVPKTSSASRYIRFAYDQGALSMRSDRLFFPNRIITRAEALKIILELIIINKQGTWNSQKIIEGWNRESTGSAPYLDVREGDWYAAYVDTGLKLCLLEQNLVVFQPNDPLSNEEMENWLRKARLVADFDTACSLPVVPEATPEGTVLPVVPITNAHVEVLSGFSTPTKVPKNATNIAFLKIDITAPETEAALVTGLTVHRRGLGDSDEIAAVKIFEGNTRHGSSRRFSKDDQAAILNLTFDPIRIPSGETKTITIAGDMAAESGGGEHRFVIERPEDIMIIGEETGRVIEIEGIFPLVSPEVGVSNTSAAELNIVFDPTHRSLTYGRKNVEIAEIRISEESGSKKAKIRSMTLFFDGVDDNELRNLRLESKGRQLTDLIPTTSNGSATFVFPENNLSIRGGEDITLILKADIFVSGDTEISIYFDDLDSDILSEPDFR